MTQLRSRLWVANSNSWLQWSPLPPTSHSPLSSEPTLSKPNWKARPSWQDDIKKGGGEEEGAEPKESARSPSQSPPPGRISEAAGDRPNQAPRHGIPKHPLQGNPRRGRTAKESRAAEAEARSGDRGRPDSIPPLKCQQAARPAPSLNTHSPQHHNKSSPPGSSPARLRAGSNVKPAPPRPAAGLENPGQRPRLAHSSAERTTEKKAGARTDSQESPRGS